MLFDKPGGTIRLAMQITDGLLTSHSACDCLRLYGRQWLNEHYGGKAAGLAALPVAWVPEYVAIPASPLKAWSSAGRDSLPSWLHALDSRGNQALTQLMSKPPSKYIARSSAAGEWLAERGRYQSVVFSIDTDLFPALTDAVWEVLTAALSKDPDRSFGIILQAFKEPDFHGHLSNEVRVSAAIEKWVYEVDLPSAVVHKRLKIIGQPLPSEAEPVRIRDPWNVSAPLAQVASWLTQHVEGRCHVEWCTAGATCWLLQLDEEHGLDDGEDPRQALRGVVKPTLKELSLRILSQYDPARLTRWSKLRNIADFNLAKAPAKHRLFYLEGSRLARVSEEPDYRPALQRELHSITDSRVVVRIDTIPPSENLPRTDSYTPDCALAWILTQYTKLLSQGTAPDNLCFIVHAFIPALAAAWTFHELGSPVAYIDSLWGLPDGLKFLSHDSFQVHLERRRIVKQIRFKEHYLSEQPDGSWQYVRIKPRLGRHATLSTADIHHLADRTVEIAQHINGTAQVMWFCGIPEELGLGQHLPWYRTEQAARSPTRSWRFERIVEIQRREDLIGLDERLPKGKVALRLRPLPAVIRSTAFLEEVAAFARQWNVPLYLEGSSLGHAFYQLAGAGATLLSSSSAGSRRASSRRVFYKLVRDKIPERIARGGEKVHAAVIARYDFRFALIAKLLEETMELLNVEDEDAVEELADVLEVVQEIAKDVDIDWRDVVTVAEIKRNERGGFEGRRILLETSVRSEVQRDEPPLLSGPDALQELSFTEVTQHRRTSDGFAIPWGVIATLSEFRNLMVEHMGARIRLTADQNGVHMRFEVRRGEQLELPFEL